jgi:hypothetical protein
MASAEARLFCTVLATSSATSGVARFAEDDQIGGAEGFKMVIAVSTGSVMSDNVGSEPS